MDGPGNAPVGAEIDSVGEPGVAILEGFQSLRTGIRKALALPDLIKAARIALIAANEIGPPDPEPARDPDIDRVRMGQSTSLGRHLLGRTQRTAGRRNSHNRLNHIHRKRAAALDLAGPGYSIGDNVSDLMAAVASTTRTTRT